MFVMTIDQRRSRSEPDAVPALDLLLPSDRTVRPFERTAGDEVQGLLDDPEAVVDMALTLARDGGWSIGIGVGEVERPLADSVRANRGPAFVAARQAVERAKSSPLHVAVEAESSGGEHAETALLLVAGIVDRRSDAGWQAVDAMATADTQAGAAASLGISPQAMNRRLRVAGYVEERRGRALVTHLLKAAR
ncbi:SatD family protein [Aeromicrobium fastidiosum]|uniref:SatD family protein n=1 Tax=Aeromicrobium fastidiosum TaxID=52699 RepID=UPI0020238426|nr:SatD family protein [Aeromicrobium fastidiosum]MCL8251318.1 SatD family protein [Aeromicrobium fastidiosum]